LKIWGKDIADAPSVILTFAQHRQITNALNEGRRRLRIKANDPNAVRDLYLKVYTDLGFGDWVQRIAHYFS